MLTWTLVATISREADNSLTQKLGGFVVGNTVVVYMARTGGIELWRSDTRGTTWNFYAISGLSGGADVTGPSAEFDGKYWIASATDGLLVHTPSNNPGMGGFTNETMPFSGGGPEPTDQSSFLYVPDVAVGGTPFASIKRRTGASTFITLEIQNGDSWNWAVKIPGTQDLLLYTVGVPTDLLRIRPSGDPVTIVNITTIASGIHNTAPVRAVAALSATEYWVSEAGTSPDPAVVRYTLDGGLSWITTNPATGFWEAFAAGGRQAHVCGIVNFEDSMYGLFTYKNTDGNPGEDRRHVKVAKRNGSLWEPESNDTNDGFRIIHALRGVNAAGNLDFYAVTCDDVTDTVKVYRATVASLSIPVTIAAVAVGTPGGSEMLLVLPADLGEPEPPVPPSPAAPPPASGEIGVEVPPTGGTGARDEQLVGQEFSESPGHPSKLWEPILKERRPAGLPLSSRIRPWRPKGRG